jgi:putative glutamine amidotransferase
VPDIPALFNSTAHGKISGQDQTHFIRVESGSGLLGITGQKSGSVNSAHHQSVEKPADALKISAYSDPAVVEAMEWKNPENRSWLLMVQWHPERMSDLSSPFSSKVKSAFLEAVFNEGNRGSFKNSNRLKI